MRKKGGGGVIIGWKSDLLIIFLPDLNRFRFDSYIVRKLSTDVSFPLKNLSLSSILSPRRKQAFGSVIDQSDLSSSSSNFSSDDQQQNPDPKYELYATVNHFGVANGGHYTAYCKYEGEKWFVKDDNTVRGLASNSISGPSTYILFFRRTKTTTAM